MELILLRAVMSGLSSANETLSVLVYPRKEYLYYGLITTLQQITCANVDRQ